MYGIEKASGETDVEAAERSNFKDMYEVINALRDHDEVLDEVIKNLRIQKGNKGKMNGRILDDYIQIIGFDLSIENLEKHIQSEIIDRMSPSWYAMFGLLKKFENDKGHKFVKNRHNKEYPSLAVWVNKQRGKKKNNILPSEYFQLLQAEGFIWDVFDERYRENIEKLIEFIEEHGHCDVPQKHPDLGRFVSKIRTRYKDQIENPHKTRHHPLTQEDIDELVEMGFEFVSPRMDVKIGLQTIQEIAKKRNGECLSKKYYDNRTKLIFKCSEKDHPRFLMAPAMLMQGKWCRKCYEDEIKLFKNKTIDDMKIFAANLGGDCLSDKYSGYTKKLLWECKNKHTGIATPWSVIRNKEWCDTCK